MGGPGPGSRTGRAACGAIALWCKVVHLGFQKFPLVRVRIIALLAAHALEKLMWSIQMLV